MGRVPVHLKQRSSKLVDQGMTCSCLASCAGSLCMRRSLRAGQHFLDVDHTDLLSTLQRLTNNSSEAEQAELQAIAGRAQQFAHRCAG